MSRFWLESYIEEGIDLKFRAYYGEKECDLLQIDGEIAKRRRSLQLILSDLNSCVGYLSSIESLDNSEIGRPLYKAFVITYGKCFAEGKLRGLSLNVKDIFKDLDEEWLRLHKVIMKFRNKYVAHSDDENLEQSEVYIVSCDGVSEVICPVYKFSHSYGRSLEKERYLCYLVGKQVEKKIAKIDVRILEENA